MVGSPPSGGFKKKLSSSMKKDNIIGYILWNNPEVQGKLEKASNKEGKEEEGEEEEEEEEKRKDFGMEKEKKVFLYNTSFEDTSIGEKAVDLLVTDIPYNVSIFLIKFVKLLIYFL